AGHHALAFSETTLYLIMIADLFTKLDDAWLKFSAAFIDKRNLTRACRHDRAGRNNQAFAHVHAELDVGVHAWAQLETGIRNIDTHLCRSLRLFEKWVDHRDAAFESVVRERVRCDRYFLSVLQHRQFALVKLRPNPNDGEVGNRNEAIADLDV